jgi:hypothetical protein
MVRAIFSIALVLVLVMVWGCKARIPVGVIACERDADCPAPLVCRHDGKDPSRYCFDTAKRDATKKPDVGATMPRDSGAGLWSDGGADARSAERSDASPQADYDASTPDAMRPGLDSGQDSGRPPVDPRVSPSSVGFLTLGVLRTGDGMRVYGDGFESGDRHCTADGQFCVTGGFQP